MEKNETALEPLVFQKKTSIVVMTVAPRALGFNPSNMTVLLHHLKWCFLYTAFRQLIYDNKVWHHDSSKIEEKFETSEENEKVIGKRE